MEAFFGFGSACFRHVRHHEQRCSNWIAVNTVSAGTSIIAMVLGKANPRRDLLSDLAAYWEAKSLAAGIVSAARPRRLGRVCLGRALQNVRRYSIQTPMQRRSSLCPLSYCDSPLANAPENKKAASF